ncbi:uncharacterized protein TNCV_1077981 [Trichonephila clavipes]|uniref:Uncharacterized protein n=1 Tax=Trichonephila clavipes TaxID=2585209 RepID=A0A8X6V759_TRICX|nr:uncharacterized protein TNCV_1077981 [Trichonephila clavipes]
MKEGLILSRYECPKCKKDMRLVERKGTIDGFEWRCRVQSQENPHFVCRSGLLAPFGEEKWRQKQQCARLGFYRSEGLASMKKRVANGGRREGEGVKHRATASARKHNASCICPVCSVNCYEENEGQ